MIINNKKYNKQKKRIKELVFNIINLQTYMYIKKYIFLAASALTLASCSSDDFLGNTPGNVQSNTSAINFDGETGKISRADHVGADAAELLNNKFIVAGFKGAESKNGLATTSVFDHYTVTWKKSTAGTTTDNTSDWSYVGNAPQQGLATITGSQTIKYWDYSTGQYDFIAFSTGKATLKTGEGPAADDDNVYVSKITPATANSSTGGAYTIQGTANGLHKCYIADLITAYNPAKDGKPAYKQEVQLSFRNLTSKVRVAFYETIPGYSVKDVKFYTDNTTDINDEVSEQNATLFTEGPDANNKFYGSGKATVYFPTVGTANIGKSDYNKAHVSIVGENENQTKDFGNLNYVKSEDNRLGNDPNYLATTKTTPTYAGVNPTDNYYQIVIPNEAGTTLTLRVNYTLVANDKSGEEIKVYGAKAIIPAIYAQWKSNFAYTYIFKISDNTNGKTSITGDTEGLYPITFDAVVADSEIGNQNTITTVATPSITTYQKGHDITKNEYSAATGDIYVMVNKDGKLIEDLDQANLYTITKTKNIDISEATVHDALTIGSSTTSTTITGRNGISLTKAKIDATITEIPGEDGNKIPVTAKTAAMFTPQEGTYAFVYETTTGSPKETAYYTAVTPEAGTDVSTYYTDPEGKTLATGTATGTTVYYQKITNTNKTYAIKVIKVVK